MKLLWGDIHNHCNITYGIGSLDNALAIARKQLDFVSITPHALWPDMPERSEQTAYIVDFHTEGFQKIEAHWKEYIETMEAANKPGELTTLFSYEMHSSQWGDHTFVSPDNTLEIQRFSSPLESVENSDSRMIAIPHHIGYTPGYRGIHWDGFNSSISPVIEVFSKHGGAMNDRSLFPYYHDMGPLDSRNTVFAGLAQGKKFGFIGSTDHHAGFPGSYGDGKAAVLAKSNSREDIWEALLARRTYAITGDKIKCNFTINDHVFGSEIERAPANISYQVEAGGAIDRVVVYKNLIPIHIVDGLTLPKTSNRYKVRLELGWGSNDIPYIWEILLHTKDVKIIGVEPCFRGQNYLSPTQDFKGTDDVNQTVDQIHKVTDAHVSFTCQTVKNTSTRHPLTSGAIVEIEGPLHGRLDFTINGKQVSMSVEELATHGVTGHMKEYSSNAYKIHTAVPKNQYFVEGAFVDKSPGDFYHLEVRQTNGSEAFVSPIYMIDA